MHEQFLSMKRIRTLILLSLLAMVALTGCGPKTPAYKQKLNAVTGETPELTFHRYEEVLFQLDTARFQEALMEIQDQYLPL